MAELTAQEKAARLQQQWDNHAAAKRDATLAFESEWREKKANVKEALHEAIRDMFREDKTVAEVSRVSGNTNYSTLYKLRADVKAGVPRKLTKSDVEVPAVVLEAINWEFSEHIGTHGWLISPDRDYVKFYGSEGTPFDGESVVATREQTLVDGNEALLFSLSARDFNKKVALLKALVEGTYDKPVRNADNPYKS